MKKEEMNSVLRWVHQLQKEIREELKEEHKKELRALYSSIVGRIDWYVEHEMEASHKHDAGIFMQNLRSDLMNEFPELEEEPTKNRPPTLHTSKELREAIEEAFKTDWETEEYDEKELRKLFKKYGVEK